MLLFTGMIGKEKKVVCFDAAPSIDNLSVLIEQADWGPDAVHSKIVDVARAILRRMVIEPVVERFASDFGEQVLRKCDSSRGFYLLADDIRVWLDLELLKLPGGKISGIDSSEMIQ